MLRIFMRILVVALLCAILSGCTSKKTEDIVGFEDKSYSLVFSDDFDFFDETKWRVVRRWKDKISVDGGVILAAMLKMATL